MCMQVGTYTCTYLCSRQKTITPTYTRTHISVSTRSTCVHASGYVYVYVPVFKTDDDNPHHVNVSHELEVSWSVRTCETFCDDNHVRMVGPTRERNPDSVYVCICMYMYMYVYAKHSVTTSTYETHARTHTRKHTQHHAMLGPTRESNPDSVYVCIWLNN